MKNLYFQRSNGSYLLIKENIETPEEAFKEVSAFLKRHNYESCYYTRYWTQNNITTFDVGSWSEFFILAPAAAAIERVVGTEKDFVDKK